MNRTYNPNYESLVRPQIKGVTKSDTLVSNDIIYLLISGDHRAFDKVYYAFYPRIIIFLKQLVKSAAVAEDLAQKVFIDLWLNKERLDPERNFQSYIYTMVRNAGLNYLKSKTRDIDQLHDVWEATSHSDEDLIAKELELLVKITVNQMPVVRKKVYQMRHDQNMTNDEIADSLGISRKAVEKHLRLALQDIKGIIQKFTMFFLYFI